MFADRLRYTLEDGREFDRLIVVQADSPADARRETGLVELAFHEATEEEQAEWDGLCSRPLTERDVETLLGFVSKELRNLARRRAKTKAEELHLVTRGMGGFVLTPEGRAYLGQRGVASSGNDPGPLLDLLIQEGVEPLDLGSRDMNRLRARKLTELRGALEVLETDDRED